MSNMYSDLDYEAHASDNSIYASDGGGDNSYDSYDLELSSNDTCFNMYSVLLNDSSANQYVWTDFLNCKSCESEENKWYEEINDTKFCPPKWDRASCWPATPAGQIASIPCMAELHGQLYDTSMNATLECYDDASWSNKSDYSNCKPLSTNDHLVCGGDYQNCQEETTTTNSHALTMIYFCGHTLSLVAVLIAFSICIYFKEMRCLRNKIHANLFLTYILANSFWLATYSASESGAEIVTCSFFVITKYFHMATFFWMFVEGLYLFVQVIATFLVENSNMKLRHYLLIGWGIPLIIVGIWAFLTIKQQVDGCPFMHEGNTTLDWIYIAPVLILLATNTFFLLSIFYVVITKLRSTGGQADHQNWKAAKALLVIIPLLGITYLITIEGPDRNTLAHVIFEHVRAVLLSTQGFTVTLPYCFLNTEVKTIVRNNWVRWRANRYIGSRGRNASARNSISMVGFYGCDSNMTNICNSRRNSFLRYAKYLSGTPAPSETMYLTNTCHHPGGGHHTDNQLVTTTALMANRISPLPREEIDLRLIGHITQISITPATPITSSPSKMEFPQNGYATTVDKDEETVAADASGRGQDLNGLQRKEDSIQNVELTACGQPATNNHHPVQVDCPSVAASKVPDTNHTRGGVAQPFSNGGQEIVKENNNIEMENEMSEHPRISADCPLLQKEEEQIEIVSSC